MNVRKALEKNGFNVKKTKGVWNISQFTPAGEDWEYDVEDLNDIVQIIEGFDPEEEFCMWVEARRSGNVMGIPSPSELWKDQEWKKETLNKVLEDIDG